MALQALRAMRWIPLACLVAACGRPADRMRDYPLTTGVLAAVNDARPFTMRISDTQHRRECIDTVRASALPEFLCAAIPPSIAERLANLSSEIAAVLNVSPTTDALWAAALIDLTTSASDGRRLDRAIARLLEVGAREAHIAAPLNHLAIAHARRAAILADPRELYAALDDIESAWARDSTSPAIGFNRAVLHSVLQVNRLAREEWVAIAAHEPDDRWRDEAAARVQALPELRPTAAPFAATAAAIRRDPQAAREFAFDSLLLRWSRATQRGQSNDAAAALGLLDTIGAGIAALHGDSSAAHIVAAMHGARATQLAPAIDSALEGARRLRATDFHLARVLLAQTVRTLRAQGNGAYADWVSNMLVNALTNEQRYEEAILLGRSTMRTSDARHDYSIAARARMVLAIAVGRHGALDEAGALFDAAQHTYDVIGEARNAAVALTLLADVRGVLGQTLAAANAAFAGTTRFARSVGAVRYEDLLILAQQQTSEGRHHGSLVLLREAALAATHSARAKDLPETLGRRSLVELATGQPARAALTISAARALAAAVRDSSMRARLDAELDRAEAALATSSDPRRALALIVSSRSHFSLIPPDDASLLISGARLALQLRDSARAEQMLSDATAEIRAFAPKALGQQARAVSAVLSDAQRERIALALARGDTSRAFALSEELPVLGPTRDALHTSRNWHTPRDAPLDRDAAEARFVVLPDGVLTWFSTRDTRRAVFAVIPRDSLAALIGRFRNLVRAGEDESAVRTLGAKLFATLFGAHADVLAGVTRLDVVTDGVVDDVPFVVLPDARNRMLVERVAIRYAIPATGRHDDDVKSDNDVPLLIGDPAWSSAEFPGLERLHHADEEVQRIAESYGRRTVLRGSEATRAAVIRELRSHSIVHFAGHSRVDVENPDASQLVLAAGPSRSDGVLLASDIGALPMSHVRLVVLSSCGRARDVAPGRGSGNGLESAFLDAGARDVVASAWEVDDAISAQLMTALHAGLAQGMTVEVALQRASVALLRAAGRSGARLATIGAYRVATGSGGAVRR